MINFTARIPKILDVCFVLRCGFNERLRVIFHFMKVTGIKISQHNGIRMLENLYKRIYIFPENDLITKRPAHPKFNKLKHFHVRSFVFTFSY